VRGVLDRINKINRIEGKADFRQEEHEGQEGKADLRTENAEGRTELPNFFGGR
jgi:hypothetical protein